MKGRLNTSTSTSPRKKASDPRSLSGRAKKAAVLRGPCSDDRQQSASQLLSLPLGAADEGAGRQTHDEGRHAGKEEQLEDDRTRRSTSVGVGGRAVSRAGLACHSRPERGTDVAECEQRAVKERDDAEELQEGREARISSPKCGGRASCVGELSHLEQEAEDGAASSDLRRRSQGRGGQ